MKFNPFTGQLDFDTPTPIDIDGTLAANSDAVVPSQKAVRTYVGTQLASLSKLQGGLDASTNPNYPAATIGDFYYVTVAGKVGGASGITVSVGDAVIAIATNAGGTQAAVGSSWIILEANIPGITTVGNALATLSNPSAITFLRLNADNTVSARAASDFRGDIGASTVGSNLFTLTNPSAISFLRVNADNTVTAQSASNFRTDIGASTVGANIFTLTNPSAVTFLRLNADNTATARAASDFRGDIGATTVGGNLFTLANPSAIRFIRINADNTVTARSAADFKTDLALPAEVGFAVSDETTNITTGNDKITLFIPYSMTVTGVLATLSTASSSGLVTVDINFNSVSMLSTKITIDANELTSFTAATPAVISNSTYTAGDTITVDIDGAGTGAKGLKLWIIGTRA